MIVLEAILNFEFLRPNLLLADCWVVSQHCFFFKFCKDSYVFILFSLSINLGVYLQSYMLSTLFFR
jgi:hypothetical protein